MYKSKQITLVLAVAPLLFATTAFAADTAADTADVWHYSIGLGAVNAPLYPGADKNKWRALPLAGASYGRYFFGVADPATGIPFGAGAYLLQGEHWKAGVALGYDIVSPRRESDYSTRLHGLGDIERAVRMSLFSRYTKNGFSLSGAFINSSNGQGMQVKLGADTAIKLTSKLSVNVGQSLTWSNNKSNQTFYGITAQQSANSGIRQYSPGAGISDLTFSVGLSYLLEQNWSVGARLSASLLPSNISDSPVVGTHTTSNVGVFTTYRF
jgi:outer membrane protein